MRPLRYSVNTLLLCVTASTGCREVTPRRGTLASLADSLIPAGKTGTCVASQPSDLPAKQPHRTCALPDSTAALTIAADGRVLNVTISWPSDSTGHVRAQRTSTSLTQLYGPSVAASEDGHGNQVRRWATDSVCVTLVELLTERVFQVSYSTADFTTRTSCSDVKRGAANAVP